MGDIKAYNQTANNLANKILKAINHNAYKKTTFLEWSFGGKRKFKWDKEKHIVDVYWDSIHVKVLPNEYEKSLLFINDKFAKNQDSTIIKRALNIFNNDSFWLVAPHKLYDYGVLRSIKKVDNKQMLLVKYTTGGTTPGDSYLWELDSNFVPISYKMYVPSMKLNGIPATWEGWITTESGTLLPTSHTFFSGNKLSMENVKGYN